MTYTEHEIFITINSVPLRYEYELHNNRLIISNNQATDGSIMRFTKNENNCIDDPLNDLQWLNDMKTSLKQSAHIKSGKIIQHEYNDECIYSVKTYDLNANVTIVYTSSGEEICAFGDLIDTNGCPDYYTNATTKTLFSTVTKSSVLDCRWELTGIACKCLPYTGQAHTFVF